MIILTLEDFQEAPFKLPNSIPAPNEADYVSDIETAIADYEREILIEGVGVDMYNSLKVSLTSPIALSELVEGKEYNLDGQKVLWGGIKPVLQNYVYYRFLRDKNDLFTTMGVQKPEAVNSTYISPAERCSRYYNQFLDLYQGQKESPIRSLYQFMCDNETDYPNASNLVVKGGMNIFSV